MENKMVSILNPLALPYQPAPQHPLPSMGSLTPLASFTCFPQLPKELQLEIWEFSLPGPRVVKLRYRGEGADAKCTSRARIPVALHVCRLSRSAALELYSLSFGLEGSSSPSPGGSRWTVEPKVYFSFSRDVLFLDTEGYRPSNNLRGMGFEDLRMEAKQFHAMVGGVRDLEKVRGLACWEYLPMVACHAVTHGEKGEVVNPWKMFEGLAGEVMGVGTGTRVWDRDLVVAEPNPLEGFPWDLEETVSLLTGLKWKQAWIVARSPSSRFLGHWLETIGSGLEGM